MIRFTLFIVFVWFTLGLYLGSMLDQYVYTTGKGIGFYVDNVGGYYLELRADP